MRPGKKIFDSKFVLNLVFDVFRKTCEEFGSKNTSVKTVEP